MSGTPLFRRSGTSSLKVMPMMPMFARLTGRSAAIQLDEPLCDERAHAIIDAAPGKDDLRIIAYRLGPGGYKTVG